MFWGKLRTFVGVTVIVGTSWYLTVNVARQPVGAATDFEVSKQELAEEVSANPWDSPTIFFQEISASQVVPEPLSEEVSEVESDGNEESKTDQIGSVTTDDADGDDELKEIKKEKKVSPSPSLSSTPKLTPPPAPTPGLVSTTSLPTPPSTSEPVFTTSTPEDGKVKTILLQTNAPEVNKTSGNVITVDVYGQPTDSHVGVGGDVAVVTGVAPVGTVSSGSVSVLQDANED